MNESPKKQPTEEPDCRDCALFKASPSGLFDSNFSLPLIYFKTLWVVEN